MSTFTNTNFAPPPASVGQMNLVNGIPQQQTPQQTAPQQHMIGLQFQHQQQQILQQKQQPVLQQQFPPGAQPVMSNMSKFMPPSSASVTSTPSSPAAAVPPPPIIAASNATPPNSMNGPPSRSMPPQVTQSNLPPHLRRTGDINGPTNANITGETPLTNGGGGNAGTFSANSSRTGSPALHSSPNHQFAPGGGVPPPSVSQSRVSVPPSTTASFNAGSGLKNNMQNLSLDRTNAPSSQQQLPLTSSNLPSNFQVLDIKEFQELTC